MSDPKTVICFTSAQSTTERALRCAKAQYRHLVKKEGRQYVFSALRVEFATVDEGYSSKSIVCCLWAERIPREEA